MEAGHLGRHGDNAAQPVVQDLSCASVPATTPHPAMGAVCVWGQVEMRGGKTDVIVTT